MSRISSGALKMNEDVFEANDFVQSVVQRQARVFRHHRIELELTEDTLYILGDEKILEHVLGNLLSNAARYSPIGSTIVLRSKRNQSYIEIEVTDEGCGIPLNEIELIFQKFHRVSGSPPGGVGLGLSIAKTLVEAHRGLLIARNRRDKSGAVFSLLLPSYDLPKEVKVLGAVE
jgi:two-component system, OmpR family, sensor histidine kinase KdpD